MLAAGVTVLGTNTEWTTHLSGGGHFRAMSPRDSDDVGAWVALPRKGADEGVSKRDQVRAELAVRLGVDFRAQPQSFLLELRPEAREEGLPEVISTQREHDCDSDIEFVSELSGDLDELCERFLKHAEVSCSTAAKSAPSSATPDTFLSAFVLCRFECSTRRSMKSANALPTTLIHDVLRPQDQAKAATLPFAF